MNEEVRIKVWDGKQIIEVEASKVLPLLENNPNAGVELNQKFFFINSDNELLEANSEQTVENLQAGLLPVTEKVAMAYLENRPMSETSKIIVGSLIGLVAFIGVMFLIRAWFESLAKETQEKISKRIWLAIGFLILFIIITVVGLIISAFATPVVGVPTWLIIVAIVYISHLERKANRKR